MVRERLACAFTRGSRPGRQGAKSQRPIGLSTDIKKTPTVVHNTPYQVSHTHTNTQHSAVSAGDRPERLVVFNYDVLRVAAVVHLAVDAKFILMPPCIFCLENH